MVVVGRDLWRSSDPSSLLKQGHHEPLAQDHTQEAFEDLQEGRFHNFYGQPMPGSATHIIENVS